MLREKQSPNYSKELLIIRKCISSVTKREEKNRSYSKLLVSGKQYVAYPKCLKHSISDILFFL